MAIAHFSPMLGRGVVYTDDGNFIIEKNKMYQPEPAGNTHLEMWMQGAGDIERIEAGEYPFNAVYDRMMKPYNDFMTKLRGELDKRGDK